MKKSFLELLQEINEREPSQEADPATEAVPVVDEVDTTILMHRDAHFSGNFEAMIQYYEKEGKGVSPELPLSRIEQLWNIEKESGENLAATVLGGRDAELVAAAKEAYKSLRDLYDNDETPETARLITDLILSEEDPPQKEMEAIVNAGRSTIPALLELLKSDKFFNELFPGYGQAPALAAQALGKLGVEQAIRPLFEALRHTDFFTEESLIAALVAIGNPAKIFLLQQLEHRPITADNERASIILGHFGNEEISKKCLEQLLDETVLKHTDLAAHLVLACENLKTVEDRTQFLTLKERDGTSETLKEEIELISRQWT